MQRHFPWGVGNVSLPLDLTRSSRDCFKILFHLWLNVLEILYCRTIVDKFALQIIQLRKVIIQKVLNLILKVLGTVFLCIFIKLDGFLHFDI